MNPFSLFQFCIPKANSLTPCFLPFHRCSREARMNLPLLHTPYSVSSSFSQVFTGNTDESAVVTHTLLCVFFVFTGVHGKHGCINRCYKHIFGAIHCKICEDKPPGLVHMDHPSGRALRLRAVVAISFSKKNKT